MFKGLKLNFVARRYAGKLRRQLAQDYGATEIHGLCDTYTVPQIRRAVAAAGLNLDYIALAYANFLSKPNFDALLDQMPVKLEYEYARSLFVKFEPIALTSGTSPAGKMGVGLGGDGFSGPGR